MRRFQSVSKLSKTLAPISNSRSFANPASHAKDSSSPFTGLLGLMGAAAASYFGYQAMSGYADERRENIVGRGDEIAPKDKRLVDTTPSEAKHRYETGEEDRVSMRKGREREAEEMASGSSTSLKKKAGAIVSDTIQSYAPLKSISTHTDGFIWVSPESRRNLEAHCLCSFLNDDVAQCLLYDSDKQNARLMGVEYIVSDRLFKNLPPEEQQLWSSNAHEVKEGLVVAPRLPEVAEHALMNDIVNTYSKTIVTWDVDKDYIPKGNPQFGFKFTEDGPPLDESLVKRRDARLYSNSKRLKEVRKDIEPPKISPNADSWKTGRAPILNVTHSNVK